MVADDAVGHQRGHVPLRHAGAEDVAEDAGVGDAHGVRHADRTLGHRLDGGAGEMGEDQLSGVARSSRAGTNRSVKALPTRRGRPARNGFALRIQMLRRPFLSRTVVIVAVDTPFRTSMAAASSVAEAGADMAFPLEASGCKESRRGQTRRSARVK